MSFGLWCLTPLSTIFHLYCWGKQDVICTDTRRFQDNNKFDIVIYYCFLKMGEFPHVHLDMHWHDIPENEVQHLSLLSHNIHDKSPNEILTLKTKLWNK
jgi:hypothetical protein